MPAPVSCGPDHSVSRFIGRERELAELKEGLDDAIAGVGRLFLISGEPGIGKTRLAEEIASIAARRGLVALWGRCSADGTRAYGLFAQILRDCFARRGSKDSTNPQSLAAPVEARLAISEILPDLRASIAQPVAGNRLRNSDYFRAQLFAAVLQTLECVSNERPAVLILEDLHDADEGSLRLLGFIARELRRMPLLVLATAREIEIRRSETLSRLVNDIVREGRQIPLGGLSREQVADMLESRTGAPLSVDAIGAIHAATGGNPLFVDGVIRIAVARGGLEKIDLEILEVTHGVHQTIRRRLMVLSNRARTTLTAAAAIGHEFDERWLIRIAGSADGEVSDSLDEAAESGICVLMPGIARRYRFAHDLIRQALLESAGASERARLHRSVGEVLEELYRDDIDAHLPELAYHFRLGALSGEVAKAIDYCVRAAVSADRVGAYADEFSLLESVLQLLPAREGKEHGEVLVHLGRLACLMGKEPADIVGYYDRAIRIFESLGNREAEAFARLSLGMQLTKPDDENLIDVVRGRSEAGRAEEVFQENEDVARLSEARMCLALGAWLALDHESGIESADSAMQLGQALDHQWVHSSNFRAIHLLHQGQIAEAFAQIEQSRARADRWNDFMARFRVAAHRGNLFLWTWQPRRALQCWAEGFRNPPLVRGSLQHQMLSWSSGLASVRMGELSEARRYLSDGNRQILDAQIAFYAGDWEYGEEVLQRAATRMRSAGARAPLCDHLFWLARLMCATGRASRAEALLREGIEIAASAGAQLLEMVFRPELISLSAGTEDVSGHLRRCREILGAGEQWHGLEGHVARAEGEYAASRKHWESAIEHLERSQTIFLEYKLPWEQASTLEAWARISIAAGDRSTALERAEAASAIYKEHQAGQKWIESVQAITESSSVRQVHKSADVAYGVFEKEGDIWSIAYGQHQLRLKDMKGLRYLAYLLSHPGQRLHASALVQAVESKSVVAEKRVADVADKENTRSDLGDAGPLLDPQAKEDYRSRLSELKAELLEAEETNDVGKIDNLRMEVEFLTEQLAAAVGLNGRSRVIASHSERARVVVTKNLRAALKKISGKIRRLAGISMHQSKRVTSALTCRATKIVSPGGSDTIADLPSLTFTFTSHFVTENSTP